MKHIYRVTILILFFILFGLGVLGLQTGYMNGNGRGMASDSDKAIYNDYGDSFGDPDSGSRNVTGSEPEGSMPEQSDSSRESTYQNYDGLNEQKRPEDPEDTDAAAGSRPDARSDLKKDELVITFDEVSSIANIGAVDKIVALSILGRLDKAQLRRLVILANDGITRGEYGQMKSMLKSSVAPQDFKRLLALAEKNHRLYSQGKLKH